MSQSISEFTSDWIHQYREIVNSFKALGLNGILAVYHIGGTSVRMKARPIIDILIVFRSAQDLHKGIPILNTNGFTSSSEMGVVGLHFLRCPSKAPKLETNIYIFENGNPHIARILLFRNMLRTNATAVTEYETIKAKSSHLNRDDMTMALQLKRRFIQRLDKVAVDAHTGPLPHMEASAQQLTADLSVQDVSLALVENLYFEMTYHAYFSETCDLHPIGLHLAVSTDISSDLFNYILSPPLGDKRDQTVSDAIDVFSSGSASSSRKPYVIWSGPHPLADDPSRAVPISDQRVEYKGHVLGMYQDMTAVLASAPKPTADGSLSIEPVRGLSHLDDFDAVHAA
eukprot:gene42797-56888_t